MEIFSMIKKFFLLMLLTLFPLSNLFATTPSLLNPLGKRDKKVEEEKIAEKVSENSPRAFFEDFLTKLKQKNYDDTIQDLDLRHISKSKRYDYAKPLVIKLKKILDRTYWYQASEVSPSASGERGDDLPSYRDLITTIEYKDDIFPIYVDKIKGNSKTSSWKISPLTLNNVNDFYKKVRFGIMGIYLPDFLFEYRFFSIPIWQLLLLFFTFLISWPLATIMVGLGLKIFIPLTKRATILQYDKIYGYFYPPLRFLTTTTIFSLLVLIMDLPSPVEKPLFFIIKSFYIISLVWGIFSIIDIIHEWLSEEMNNGKEMKHLGKKAKLPIGKKTIKLVISFFSLMVMMQNWGIDITAFFAGLGVGGIAIALAGQKTIENLFGGAVLLLDRPVKIGDFCKFGSFMGIVEEIGLRSTRVRTLDRTVITIPNADFSQMQIENYKRRDQILLNLNLSTRYETSSAQLKMLLFRLKKMLVDHPNVGNDPARVRLMNFAAFSIDIQVYAYILTDDYSNFLLIKEGILFDIKNIFEEIGVEFAFPSQTIYRENGAGVSQDKINLTGEEIAKMKADKEKFLAQFDGLSGEELTKYLNDIL